MSSRDAILSRIRKSLAGEPDRPLPPIPEVWPIENPPVEKLVERFTTELEAIAGEVQRSATMEEASRKLIALMDELGAERIGRTDHALCEELTAELPGERFIVGQDDPDPKELARLPAGLVAADTLLADTGSSMIACATPHHRLMCYLPPVSIVVAKTDQLAEHLPAAWDGIAARAAGPALRGEFVLITGPSRTADIEKILILGVHGPKRLIVLLVG